MSALQRRLSSLHRKWETGDLSAYLSAGVTQKARQQIFKETKPAHCEINTKRDRAKFQTGGKACRACIPLHALPQMRTSLSDRRGQRADRPGAEKSLQPGDGDCAAGDP